MASAHDTAGAVPVHPDSELTGGPADPDASRFVWQPGDLVLVQPAPTSTTKQRLIDAAVRAATKKP